MTSSSPCHPLPDPFSDEAIALELRHTWRRALPGASDLDHVRAKSIRLGETATPTQSRESNRNSNVVSIDQKAASVVALVQGVPHVHPRSFTDDERCFLDVIDENGGRVAGKFVAEEMGISLDAVRTLAHRLWKIGAVEITRRGYTRGSR